jgi:hypothetical protein
MCAHSVKRVRKKGISKNIVFLSKKVPVNSEVKDVVSPGIMRCLTPARDLAPNIVFLSKSRRGNIVFLSKDYCVPG